MSGKTKPRGGDADQLGHQLPGVTVEQNPLTPFVPSANRPTEMTPQRPLVPWTEIAPTGSSTPQDAVDEFHADTNQHAGDEADDDGADGIDVSARRGDRHQAREQAVAGIEASGLPYLIHM